MTDYPAAQVTYNNSGFPFHVDHLFTVKAINKTTGVLDTIRFSTRKLTETFTVRAVEDGTDSVRTYTGGKHVLRVPPIKHTQAMTVDEHEIELSSISTLMKDMVFGHYTQRAYFEWHVAQWDRRNGSKLIATPVCEFVGMIDNITEKKDAKDRKTGLTKVRFLMNVVGRHAEFEYTSGKMRTLEESKSRSGDMFYEYTASVGDWAVGWGKDIHRHRDHGNKNGRDGGGRGGNQAGGGGSNSGPDWNNR